MMGSRMEGFRRVVGRSRGGPRAVVALLAGWRALVALEPRLEGRLEVVAETDLEGEVAYLAALSGLAIAEDALYLTLESEPFLVRNPEAVSGGTKS